MWFKEAGAEGAPADGMYLSPEKWKAAYIKTAAEESAIPDAEPGKLAEWIWENKAKTLVEACYKAPPAPAASSGGAAAPTSQAAPPEYPLTINFKDLADKLDQARGLGRQVLILANGCDQVDTFLQYQNNIPIDCKQILNECLIKKSKTKEAWQAELRRKLCSAMNTNGFAKPLFIRFANSAFDFNSFCCDDFPEDLFSGSLWTLQNALDRGIIDEGAKLNLEIEDEKQFKKFHVIMTSIFSLAQANQHLLDKIPHYDELAILVVDPKSVE